MVKRILGPLSRLILGGQKDSLRKKEGEGGAVAERREVHSFPFVPILAGLGGEYFPCGHLCRGSSCKGARKGIPVAIRGDTVKGWLSFQLCLLKLGTEVFLVVLLFRCLPWKQSRATVSENL